MKQTENTHHKLHGWGSLTNSPHERILIPGESPSGWNNWKSNASEKIV